MPKNLTKTENNYDSVLTNVAELLEQAHRLSARSVNAIMTATYWEIGRQIVEFEQDGEHRAEYGKELLKMLSSDLTKLFGRGFGVDNLQRMRGFYQFWTPEEIYATVSPKSKIEKYATLSRKSEKIVQTASGQSSISQIAKRFPLPWSHYVSLLSCKNENARKFYEDESLRGGWTVRQLKRQINSKFYERTALSKDKVSMLKEIKDPLVLEFLNLKDEYSEIDLEDAIIRYLQNFLLEMGKGFAFVGRQMRLRIDDEWFRVDLVLFNRRLKCLVIIDLKLGKFSHADVGQMLLYTNYANEHWREEGENPPIGLILCDQKSDALAHYTLENLPNKVLASEYKMLLPSEEVLVEEIKKARRLISK
jgi:predicted nuclease of restriction endonuclease-like (RecB) superfamily